MGIAGEIYHALVWVYRTASGPFGPFNDLSQRYLFIRHSLSKIAVLPDHYSADLAGQLTYAIFGWASWGNMLISAFTIDGVLPPYVGVNGPGGPAEDMTPYAVLATEVVATLGATQVRRTILRNWLEHRRQIRAQGIVRGFQWLDGSFVESKEPRDLDVVTFLRRPDAAQTVEALIQFLRDHAELLQRRAVKARYNLDLFLVDMDGTPETIVHMTRYYLGLFSHRRQDGLWKGMLQVGLENQENDVEALEMLEAFGNPEPGGEVVP